MARDQFSAAAAHFEHLSSTDLELLAGADDRFVRIADQYLRRSAMAADTSGLLAFPAVFDAIFGRNNDGAISSIAIENPSGQ
jgi:hypothetical protein